MGWFRDNGEEFSYDHEGWVQAVVRDGRGWRDLGLNDERKPNDYLHEFMIQVCCECGWRSQRLTAPLAARWSPASVIMDERYDDAAYEIWTTEHRDNVTETSHRALNTHPVAMQF